MTLVLRVVVGGVFQVGSLPELFCVVKTLLVPKSYLLNTQATSPAHKPCTQASPAHKPVHKPCTQALYTSPVHKPCTQALYTSPAHKPCTQALHTSPVNTKNEVTVAHCVGEYTHTHTHTHHMRVERVEQGNPDSA